MLFWKLFFFKKAKNPATLDGIELPRIRVNYYQGTPPGYFLVVGGLKGFLKPQELQSKMQLNSFWRIMNSTPNEPSSQ